ncbi:MAG TPA: glycoside hydrolase family 140 protein [Polyangiaceae bacterium]
MMKGFCVHAVVPWVCIAAVVVACGSDDTSEGQRLTPGGQGGTSQGGTSGGAAGSAGRNRGGSAGSGSPGTGGNAGEGTIGDGGSSLGSSGEGGEGAGAGSGGSSGGGNSGGRSGAGGRNSGGSATGGQSGSGGSNGGTGNGGGSFEPAVFPLRVSEDERRLEGQDGKPFFLNGEAAWSLMVQLTDEEADAYLRDRAARGFNLVMVNLLEHDFADDPPRNAYGDGPFTTPNDFSTPDEAYFAHVDGVIERANELNIAVLLSPAYLGFNGGTEGWYQVMVQNGVETMRDYGRYVGERYAGFDNIVWLEGGDYTPPDLSLTNAVAEGIKEFDSRHVHAAHWSPETSGGEVTVSGWLDLGTTYTYGPVYVKSLQDYNRNDGRPHFMMESNYEEEHGSTPSMLRGQAYYALLTGAFGHVFGHYQIWQFLSTWRGALGSPGSTGMSHFRALFEGIAWTTLIPDQDHEILTGGLGEEGSREYAVLAASADGSLAVAYLPTVRGATIDLGRLAGPVRARFYDPSDGSFSEVSGSPFDASGSRTFTAPGDNASGASDWVLVLDTAP